MFQADKLKDKHYTFKLLKDKLDRLGKEELRIRSTYQEQKFAYAHSIEKIHDFIDLKGYSGFEAV
jgi:hypothetical protein